MFRPVQSTSVPNTNGTWFSQMADESGIIISIRGIGREDQSTMAYQDSRIALEVAFSIYRNSRQEKQQRVPPIDWSVYIDSAFSSYLASHPDIDERVFLKTVGMNIAECLFKWPISAGWNPFQAETIEIIEKIRDYEIARSRIISLPPEWRIGEPGRQV